jgi:phage tail sheath protein FI
MPTTPTFPGVYIEEVPSSVRTVSGVATSIAAFVDFFARGPMNRAVQLFNMGDFEREFGGLDTRSEASYGISQFFLNGGGEAWVVRAASGNVQNPLRKATAVVRDGIGSNAALALTHSAASEGSWPRQHLRPHPDRIRHRGRRRASGADGGPPRPLDELVEPAGGREGG